MNCLRFSIVSDSSCDCCDRCSFSSRRSKALPIENCTFSSLRPIDSVDSLGPFRCFKQMPRKKQTNVTANSVPMKTAVNESLLSVFFKPHAPAVQFLSSPQHCPVEQSSFVLHAGTVRAVEQTV